MATLLVILYLQSRWLQEAPPQRVMRVKLRGSAESAEQQSPGWKSMRSGLWNPGIRIGFRLDPVRAMQQECAAFTGLLFSLYPTQGYGRFAASTLGFAAASLTGRMSERQSPFESHRQRRWLLKCN